MSGRHAYQPDERVWSSVEHAAKICEYRARCKALLAVRRIVDEELERINLLTFQTAAERSLVTVRGQIDLLLAKGGPP